MINEYYNQFVHLFPDFPIYIGNAWHSVVYIIYLSSLVTPISSFGSIYQDVVWCSISSNPVKVAV